MFAGGIADKLGNRYEAKWVVRQLLDVVGGGADWILYEGISPNFAGFEFAVRRNDIVEWHQTKINNPGRNWTLASLSREGVLSAFKRRLSANNDDVCVFISQDPAKDIDSLAVKARLASTVEEINEALGKGSKDTFLELQRIWSVDARTALAWLKRSRFQTESQPAIESAIAIFSDVYFFESGSASFEVLREYAETQINRKITTEKIRGDLRAERRLTLRDWSLDPTLKERLSTETNAYLATYTPFGLGGVRITRSETSKLTAAIKNPIRPSAILLTGIAGAGKSGVIREFVHELSALNILHLAFRVDHHLDCSTPKSLGKAITEREESPVTTLKGASPGRLSVLIVDQVDAISEVSGRSGAVRNAVLRLIDEARNLRDVVLVIACRTFDLESDPRLKALRDDDKVEHINVQLLEWETEVRYYSGHHFGSDAFLDMFRTSMRRIAASNPSKAESILRQIPPEKHEVCTHLWFETIASNGKHLSQLLTLTFDSPYVLESGWNGADWKSFAGAAKASIPFLEQNDSARLESLIFNINPELRFASQLLTRIKKEGERTPPQTNESVIYYVGKSGYERWCVLEEIGYELLSVGLRQQLEQLRRKFRGATIPNPQHLEAHWVQSPIKRDRAKHMSNAHWLNAIKRYRDDTHRHRENLLVEGGASQLAGELQHLSKEHPAQFVDLLEEIPDNAIGSYISHLLWGLAESSELDSELATRAVLNAHDRPNRPYGSDIARIIGKMPSIASNPTIFAVLVWYVEHGDAAGEDIDTKNVKREISTIEDLLESSTHLHVRGINGARGSAAETLGAVLWQVPEVVGQAWALLEHRAAAERLISVRCCLIQPAVPLFNNDPRRCAGLVDSLSNQPGAPVSRLTALSARAWIWLAFPTKKLPDPVGSILARCAHGIERLSRALRHTSIVDDHERWWSPLITHRGVYLFSFLLRSVPDVANIGAHER